MSATFDLSSLHTGETMDMRKIRNEYLIGSDFAKSDRAVFLRALPKTRLPESGELAPGLPVKRIWMTDVSGTDRRSVKAHLAARGSFRATWWNVNCWLHQRLWPEASLEQIMFAFHQRHHALTLLRLECILNFLSLMDVCKNHGVIAGIRHALTLAAQSSGGRP